MQLYDQNAEMCVLGCLLYDKRDVIEYALDKLTENDFYYTNNADIFSNIKNLHLQKSAIDIITVSGVGHDIEYLTNIQTLVPTTEAIRNYVDIVKSLSIRRQFVKAAENIVGMARNKEYETLLNLKSDAQHEVDIDIAHDTTDVTIKDLIIKAAGDIEARYQGKSENKKIYGIPWLDKVTGGAHDTEITVIAARPSVGKTSFAMQIAKNMAWGGHNVGIFSLEMGSDQLVERLLANESNLELQKLRVPKLLSDSDWQKLGKSQGWLSELPIRIADDIYSVEEIRAKCRELKNKDRLDFIVIDYLQLMETSKKCGTSNERVSHISRQVKLMAKEFRVPIWILSQLSRANEQGERRPKLTDLRDSGAIEQDADNVIFLYDPNYGKYATTDDSKADIELIIAKQRNGLRDIYSNITFNKPLQQFRG